MANHEELIRSGSFDSKFKNALRDYYSYGFMSFGELGKTLSKDGEKTASATTLNEDWTRLNNILGDYFKWSADKSSSLFASTDSRLLYENPFHRIYRFCRYNSNDPVAFFNIIFALSPKVNLRDGLDSLELPLEIDDENITRLEQDINEKNPLLSSQLMCFYSDNKEKLFSGDNNAINTKLKELVDMGLVEDKAEKSGKRTNHRWGLTPLYLSDIIESGEKADPDFYGHFTAALEFFSKYFFLGEVGSFILSRLPCLKSPQKQLFRLKHEYFAAALSDYNLFDLLSAIENKRWIKISYRNGLTGVSTKLICFPLEIRISSVNGREYLTFYEPFVRNYSNLRLEFVDSVEYIKEGAIQYKGRIISLEDSLVKSDIEKAKTLISYSWGAATLGADSLNDDVPLSKVSFKIKYDPKTEPYIPARLNREKRGGVLKKTRGQISFSAEVLKSGEMLPWIRSFYSRLYDYEDSSDFSLEEDVEQMISQTEDPRLYYEKPPKRTTKSWEIPADCKYKAEPKPSYSLLFNEAFGIYYSLMGEILMKLYSADRESFSKEQLDLIIRETVKAHKNEMGVWTEANLRKEIRSLLEADFSPFMRKGEIPKGMSLKGTAEENKWFKALPKWLSEKSQTAEKAYRPKYSMNFSSFGSEICPLTKTEIRWLLTILEDEKIDLFLEKNEKDSIKKALALNPQNPFKSSSVIYFDRFYKEHSPSRERQNLIKIIAAIKSHSVIEANYLSVRGSDLKGRFMPIAIEYSKRDDVFRIFALPCGESGIFTMNLDGIRELTVIEEKFDCNAAMTALEDYFRQNKAQITVEFYDSRNLADRILSEFSPWEKQCLYNKETELYTLTIYYQKTDELEMVIRLMGYGNEIAFKDSNHPIVLQIKERLYKQREIIKAKKTEENRT